MRHADAAIIITGTASHILVQIAKEFAKRLKIPWTCIAKASDKQVATAIHQLFPQAVTSASREQDSS